jgi:hypothetical protein
MPVSPKAPSIVPNHDHTVHLVLDDFGKIGRTYREVDVDHADQATVVENILSGEYEKPEKVVAFNTAEGWACDVSEEIAGLVQAQARAENRDLSSVARESSSGTTMSFPKHRSRRGRSSAGPRMAGHPYPTSENRQ